jgi:hypothetical protein
MFEVKYNTLDVSLTLVLIALSDAAVVVASETAPYAMLDNVNKLEFVVPE